MGGRQFRGFALAIIVLIIMGAGLYYLLGFPTASNNAVFEREGPRIVALTILAVVFSASLVFGQPKAGEVLRAVVFWGGLAALLVTGYTFRSDLITGGYRVLGALAPGLAVNQDNGTILVIRDSTGHFHIDSTVNGKPVKFLLDTGASAVVLTYEDALNAGYRKNELSFTTPVSTANGRSLVAPVKIDRIRVGNTSFRKVRAFVARPGALETSLLGMTALDRLKSWYISGDRLTLNP